MVLIKVLNLIRMPFGNCPKFLNSKIWPRDFPSDMLPKILAHYSLIKFTQKFVSELLQFSGNAILVSSW